MAADLRFCQAVEDVARADANTRRHSFERVAFPRSAQCQDHILTARMAREEHELPLPFHADGSRRVANFSPRLVEIIIGDQGYG